MHFLGAKLPLILLLIASGINSWCEGNTMLMGATSLEALLQNLMKSGQLSSQQFLTLVDLVGNDLKDVPLERNPMLASGEFFSRQAIVAYLTGQTDLGALQEETSYYIANALNLVSLPSVQQWQSPAPANYTGFGKVQLLGHWKGAGAPNTNNIYNGIWGYAVGSREYALQGNFEGLHILDITDPSNIFRVQFIAMSGGKIWRDVATHTDSKGRTYAYVHAQYGAVTDVNLWVINLTYLSGSQPHNPESNPIPRWGYRQISGFASAGHTMNVAGGFVFINSATGQRGVYILDVSSNPMFPKWIAQWTTGDGHDTFFLKGVNVPGLSGPRDLMYSSDGYRSVHSILDLTDLRQQFLKGGGRKPIELVPIGTTNRIQGQYAHSSIATTDGSFMYICDESNLFDIGIYNLTDPRAPVFVRTFQYSGNAEANSRIHNARIRGKYLIAAYYYAGFRVFDISNPVEPIEVGYWPTSQDPNGDGQLERPNFIDWTGGWNVYVDFASGKILCSDTDEGTFVLKINE